MCTKDFQVALWVVTQLNICSKSSLLKHLVLSLQRCNPSHHFVSSSTPKQMIYSVFHNSIYQLPTQHPAHNGGQQTVIGCCESQMAVCDFPWYWKAKNKLSSSLFSSLLHRIESSSFEKTSKITKSSPQLNTTVPTKPCLHILWSTSMDCDSTTSLCSLFLCQATLSVKFFIIPNLTFPWCNLKPFPLVLEESYQGRPGGGHCGRQDRIGMHCMRLQ